MIWRATRSGTSTTEVAATRQVLILECARWDDARTFARRVLGLQEGDELDVRDGEGDDAVKLLSLRQPWAWAILDAAKRIENRKWNTHYRGPILIHAAKGCRLVECAEALEWMFDRMLIDESCSWPGLVEAARGGIIGRANIVDVIEPSPWTFPPETIAERNGNVDLRWYMRGLYGFVLADVEALPFVPWPGMLGLLNAPPALLHRIEQADHVGP